MHTYGLHIKWIYSGIYVLLSLLAQVYLIFSLYLTMKLYTDSLDYLHIDKESKFKVDKYHHIYHTIKAAWQLESSQHCLSDEHESLRV